jgi:hypothetical protein
MQPTVAMLAAQPAKGMMQLAPTAHGKLRAIIELKALCVREKQRALRAQVVECLPTRYTSPLISNTSAEYVDLPGVMRV